MAHMAKDIRYALRTLRRSPGFAIVAILTLALGIGANTAIFSVINAVLLRPLPFFEPDRLVTLNHEYPSLHLQAGVSVPGFLEYDKHKGVFASAGVQTGWAPTLTGHGDPVRLRAVTVAGDYFSTLGVKALLGRSLRADESTAGNDKVVVLSEPFWRTTYGADPGIVGQRILLNGESYEVVGVMPRSLTSMLSRNTDVWVPLVFTPRQISGSATNEFLGLRARLKEGVSIETAQAEMTTLATRLRTDRPNDYSPDWTLRLTPLRDLLVDPAMRKAMLLLLGAVGLVLLIACANVANLQLARAAARSREIAVRVALGASPGALIRQLLTESVILSLAGGALGLLFALWGVPALLALNSRNLPPATVVGLDAKVLLFTLLLSLLTGLIFGLAPALRVSRTSLQESLKEGGRGAAGDRAGLALRRGLVVATVAIALMLLVGAGLLTRSFTRLVAQDPGFRTDHLVTFNIGLPDTRYPNDTVRTTFFDRATEAIAAVPGVTAAGATSVMPFTNNWSTSSFNVEGHVVEKGANMPWGDVRLVTPGFLPAIGAPLLKGREFTDQDDANAPQVAIVDAEMVRRYWPDQDPIGKRITFNDFTDSVVQWIQVVGVVGHTMHEGLDAEKRIQVYFPLRQNGNRGMTYAVRTTGDPLAAMPGIRAALKSVDADVAIANITPMDELVATTTGPRRFSMVLLAVFSGLAAALAAIGLYGVMSYTVTQRSRELAVRLALGATPAGVQRLVMGQGMRLAAFGVGFGLVAALALTNLLRAFDNAATVKPAERLLFGVNANDPATFASISLFLLGVTLLATWLPARRATSVDPVVALRDE
jgi:predicted permease